MKKLLLLLSILTAMSVSAMEEEDVDGGSSGESVKVLKEALENVEEDRLADGKPGETILLLNEAKTFAKKKSKNPRDRKRAVKIMNMLVKKREEKLGKSDDKTTKIEEYSLQSEHLKNDIEELKKEIKDFEEGFNVAGAKAKIEKRLAVLKIAIEMFEKQETSDSPTEDSTVEEEVRKEGYEVNTERKKVLEKGGEVFGQMDKQKKAALENLGESLKELERLYEKMVLNMEKEDNELGANLDIIDEIEKVIIAMEATHEGIAVAEVLVDVTNNQEIRKAQENDDKINEKEIKGSIMKSLKKKLKGAWGYCVVM